MLADNNRLLELAFDVFNEVYLGETLPKAVVAIQLNYKAYGYITAYMIQCDNKKIKPYVLLLNSYHIIGEGNSGCMVSDK